MTNFKRLATVSMLMFVVTGFRTPASAQEVTPGQTEAVGFIGGVTDGGGFTFGGGVHYAFDPRWLFVGELGYLTGSADFEGLGVDVDSHAISIDLNAHYLFPSATNRRLAFYALGGVGILRASASVAGPGVDTSVSDTEAGLNIGGGARWRAGDRWGVRPELKVLIASNSSVRFTVGLYYSFGAP